MTTWTSPATAALAHARRGWVLVPCQPGTGKPARKWRDLTGTPPSFVVAHWPGPDYNPAVITEASRLVVIDLDSADHGGEIPPGWDGTGISHGADVLAILAERAGQTIPATYEVITPRHGRHLYFQAPANRVIRNSARKIGPMVDVRGRGGIVIAAGAIRLGKPYELADDRDPAPLPEWLADLADPPVTRDRYVTRDVQGHANHHVQVDANRYAQAAFRAEIATLLAAPRGRRNHQLNASSFALGTLIGAYRLDEDDVTRELLYAAEQIGLVDDDGATQCQNTIASGITAGKARPRSVS